MDDPSLFQRSETQIGQTASVVIRGVLCSKPMASASRLSFQNKAVVDRLLRISILRLATAG